MTIDQLFNMAIDIGKKGDNRDLSEIDSFLNRKKETYNKIDEDEKKYYDCNELSNPYMDSAIYHDSKKNIKKLFVGIDTEVQELILADRLGADAVLGHHPEGKSLLGLWKVMEIHTEALIKAGVPVNVAERLIEERQEELERSLHGINYNRAVDAAVALDITFANIHTPADNLANSFMQNFISNKKPENLGDILKSTLEISEYKEAAIYGSKAKIISGSPSSRTGKIFVKFNGGTSSNKNIFKYLETAGISTFICMHLPEPHLEEAKKHNINVIVMPHMASDTLGMNLLLDEVEKFYGELEIISGSGYKRFKR